MCYHLGDTLGIHKNIYPFFQKFCVKATLNVLSFQRGFYVILKLNWMSLGFDTYQYMLSCKQQLGFYNLMFVICYFIIISVLMRIAFISSEWMLIWKNLSLHP